MALSPAVLVARRFDPRRIPGLESWWDAADSASVTLSSGRISQWSDKSGKGRHATNSTAGTTQPSYALGVRNGLNVARFTAANTQVLTVPSSTAAYNFLHNGTQCYFVAVSAYGTTADPNAYYALLGNNTGTTGFTGVLYGYDDRSSISANNALRFDALRAVTASIVANAFNAGNTAILSDYSNLAPAQSFVVQEVELDLSNSTAASRVRIRANGGAAAASNNKTGAPANANAPFDFQLGGAGNNTSPLQGDICEILIFSQIPTPQARDLVRLYLARKWGVTLA
jgi:hypothetical protein